MEIPFFTSSSGGAGATRTEALRWLAIAEKLLAGRDLVGSKSFAVRAKESDPNLYYADQIIAVADTLLAGDKRINNQHDWYAILQLGGHHQIRDSELIASQYRELATVLNPQKNNLPYADHAFTLVLNAWSVLSNPSTKSMYDNEIMSSQLEFNSLSHGSNNPNMVAGVSRDSQVNFQPFEINFQVMPQHQQQQQVTQPIPHYGMSKEQVTQHFPQHNVSREQAPQPPPQPQQNLTPRGQVRQPKPMPPPQPHQPPPLVQQQPQPQPQQQRKEYWMGTNVTVTHNFPGVVENSNANISNTNITNNNVHVSGNTSNNVAENVENVDMSEEERRMDEEAPDDDGEMSFWTACPYCYYMYEYPNVYAECALKCQNCKKAFQAVVIPDPPHIIDGQGEEAYFCCWGMMPLGVSMDILEKNKEGRSGGWTPFSPMFTCPQGFGRSGGAGNPSNFRDWNASNVNNNVNVQGSRGGNVGGRKHSGPRVYVDNEDVFVEVSGSSEEDDHDLHRAEASDKGKKTTKGAKRKASVTPIVAQEGVPISNPNLSYPHLFSQLF